MSDRLTIQNLKRKVAELERVHAYPRRVLQASPQLVGNAGMKPEEPLLPWFTFEGEDYKCTADPAIAAVDHKAMNMTWDTSEAYFKILEQKRQLLQKILPQWNVLEKQEKRLKQLKLDYPQMFPKQELELTSDEEETAEEKTPGAA